MPKVAFVTNAKEYAGPPAAAALARAGWDVFCSDQSFASTSSRKIYELENPRRYAASARDAAEFVAEGLARFGRIDALISNDIPTGSRLLAGASAEPLSDASDLLDEVEVLLDTLVAEPVRLLRAALPLMKAARSGSIVLVTSGAPLRTPTQVGVSHIYIAARAATNALTKSLAREVGAYNIQVNAVAPFFVYSPTFFPSEIGAKDPKYMPFMNQCVPMQRFGAPEEIGTLIALLGSCEMGFVSGQVIAFSGAGC